MDADNIKSPDKKKKKILIVDYGSKSAERLSDFHKEYHKDKEIPIEVEIKNEKEILGLTKEEIQSYSIIHKSGSRVRKLSDEVSKYMMDNVGDDTYVLGTCHGAQVIADYHGVETKKLADPQKGKKEIKYADNYGGKVAHIHKNHAHAIPVDEGSNLEEIATSEQEFSHEEKPGETYTGKAYEVFKVKGKNQIGIQGHGEQGVGKEVLNGVLDNHVYNSNKKHDRKKAPDDYNYK